MATPYCIVLITVPNGPKAKTIASKILKARLAACVNAIPHVSSIYRWKGKIETGREVLLIIKTKRKLIKELNLFVKKIHPYDLPEIISIPINDGLKPYLQWINAETRK